MKTNSKFGKTTEKLHEASLEREQNIADAADFHTKRMVQKQELEANREFANKPVGNAEFEQAKAEDVNFDIDGRIAGAAFFIAQRRDVATGNETSDWLQAETNVEGVLNTPLIERRHGTSNDRRSSACPDRRM